MKRFLKNFLIMVGFLTLFLSSTVLASQQGIPEDTWPESWFEAPKTASELGITDYNQSPVLDDQDLPAVEERLPEDPIVVEPVDEIGKYGGTAVTFTTSGLNFGEGEIFNKVEGLVKPGPGASKVIPSYAKKYEISEDGKALTFHLREGIKWSDGHPLTAEDFIFWWEREAQNSDLNPVPPEQWSPVGLEDVVAVDDYTIRFEFVESNPLAINKFVQERTLGDDYGWVQPAHFLKDYHIDFVSEEEMQEELDEHEYDSWDQYYNEHGKDLYDPDTGYPRLTAYVVTEETSNMYVLERNPYYPKVDPEGNQLPYIDELQVHEVQEEEMLTTRAATGEATAAGIQTSTTDIPLFKRNQEEAGFKTMLWHRLQGTDVAIQFNMNHQDQNMREIFQNPDFRRAMSLAIDRDEINESIYYGEGTPRQTSVIPSSRYFEEEYATAFTDYNPERAKDLLDQVGLVDVDDDGVREMPDGEDLNITLEWTPMETPKGPTMELVVDHWSDIGIEVDLEQISTDLQHERTNANEMDMTLWHGDRSTDLLFPGAANWYAPIAETWFETCMWREWARYVESGGDSGEQPPEDIQKLVDSWRTANQTVDEEERIEAGKMLLEANAKNLWTIGTVGLAPTPVIIDENLENVPEDGYLGWDNRYFFGYHPETWYLDE